MNRKLTIEITADGITKTFIDKDGKEYEEKWYRTNSGSACNAAIEAQLDQNGDYEEEELLEVLEFGDLDEIWEYFEQNN